MAPPEREGKIGALASHQGRGRMRGEPVRDDVPLGEADDTTLARKAALGDRDAFAVIARRHGPAMYRFARRVLQDDGDAEDAVQEALVAAWRDLPRFRGTAALRTWLFRLTVNRAHTVARKRRPSPLGDPTAGSGAGAGAIGAAAVADPAQEAIGESLLAALDVALAELPERSRIAWILREIDGLSYDEVVAVTGMTRTSIRGHVYRARRTLALRMATWR